MVTRVRARVDADGVYLHAGDLQAHLDAWADLVAEDETDDGMRLAAAVTRSVAEDIQELAMEATYEVSG